jgi:hypothetical protein
VIEIWLQRYGKYRKHKELFHKECDIFIFCAVCLVFCEEVFAKGGGVMGREGEVSRSCEDVETFSQATMAWKRR